MNELLLLDLKVIYVIVSTILYSNENRIRNRIWGFEFVAHILQTTEMSMIQKTYLRELENSIAPAIGHWKNFIE